MTELSWIATGVVAAYTLYLMWFVGRLNATWKSEDDDALRRQIRKIMPRVGWWQITLGLAMIAINLDNGDGVGMNFTLIFTGASILLMDWVAKKFEAVTPSK